MALCGKCQREAPAGALFCSFCGASIRPETAAGEPLDPLIGLTVNEKYLVHERIGGGGMGDVYKANHITLDRPVVLKLLKKSFLSDPSIVQRFHREARAASRLNHPNSISIIDFGQTEDGTLFMAMEYLSGRSLARVIAEDQPIPEARVVHIGAQILSALAEAHALGIIHRDLKPENVMLESRRDEPDFVKVLDFGIAKLNEPGDKAGKLTQAGIVCGTPGYMSPEQVRGDELDPRSDLYSVGVILYEMLSGKLPFEADTPMGLVTKHLIDDVPPFAARRPGLHVSPGLESLVLRCLAKERAQRPGSAEELRAALLAWVAQGERTAGPMPTPVPTLVMEPPQASPRPRTEPDEVKVWRPPTGAAPGAAAPPAAARASQRPSERMPVTTAVVPTPAPRPSERIPARRTPEPGGTLAMASPRPSSQPLARAVVPSPAQVAHPRAGAAGGEPGRSAAGADLAAPAPARSKLPIVAGAGAAVIAIAGVVAWGAMRPAPKPAAALREAPAAKAPVREAAAAAPPAPAPAAVILPPAPEQRPAEAPPPDTAAQEPAPPAAKPPEEAPAKPAAHAGEASERARRKAKPQRRVADATPAAREARGGHAKGIRTVREELNSIPTPPVRSGEGVLSVIASPWAEVWVDGVKIGETPREMRLGAGTYRVRATHPSLGTREVDIEVPAGKRKVWSATFAN